MVTHMKTTRNNKLLRYDVAELYIKTYANRLLLLKAGGVYIGEILREGEFTSITILAPTGIHVLSIHSITQPNCTGNVSNSWMLP